jgi:hypothetical protein
MLKNIRLPAEIVLYMLTLYYYGEYAVSREVSNYILLPSTIVVIYLTWYIIKRTLKTINNKLEL